MEFPWSGSKHQTLDCWRHTPVVMTKTEMAIYLSSKGRKKQSPLRTAFTITSTFVVVTEGCLLSFALGKCEFLIEDVETANQARRD